ncbi:hypothetical protein F4778DRAFT_774853 [Xylariomycetidae sp. FL2044]|nr:hypothetical protein F4778DRAFT_774853 [Xylariomycetidae sp. FL2044]
MADEDFEIDVYGDGDAHAENDSKLEDINNQAFETNSAITIANGSNPTEHDNTEAADHGDSNTTQNPQSAGPTGNHRTSTPSFQQGVKRKGSDDRPIDPGATNCLLMSELHWWTTDDEIRNWARSAGCEDELKEITFSEHKVNGKSKGQAYIEFTSQQAATAAKHQIDAGSDASQGGGKKHTIIYSSPNNNPFKTLPKDAPARANKDTSSRGGSNSGGYNDRGGGFRGRGGFNGPRGGFNRNFSGGGNMGGGGGGGGFHGGFNNNNNPNMGGGNFGFNNMGGGNFGGFRGGMGGGMGGGIRGGMRGGRGGMNTGMNPGMNPGGMNMNNGMMPPMGMGMPMMGFQQPHFNPAFFGGGQQSDWQNPHGAKRPRGE